jgi:hypothetical protein
LRNSWAHTPDPPRSADPEAEQVCLVPQMKGLSDDEEKGTRLVGQAQEGEEADREFEDSSVLLEASEPDAHTLDDTSVYSHRRLVPDVTERYCGSRLPIER